MKTGRSILVVSRELGGNGDRILPSSFSVSSALKLYNFLVEKYEILGHFVVDDYRHRNGRVTRELFYNGPNIPSYEVFRKKLNVTGTFHYDIGMRTGSHFYLKEEANSQKIDYIIIQRIPLIY